MALVRRADEVSDDEVGYVGRLAETAAVLFDELGLHGYAAICRSDETAKVHEAFDRSDAAGRSALRKAIERSGIDRPVSTTSRGPR